MTNRNMQHGFTLIELLVSITLGLLVVAAASQLFITGQVSVFLQRSSADILDNGNFGLNYLTKDIRMANLGGSVPVIDDTTAYGGIVLAQANVTKYVTIDSALLTRGNGQNGWAGASNVNTAGATPNTIYSDQLTIQYQPVQTAISRAEFATPWPTDATDLATLQAKYAAITIGYDCTGSKITLQEAKQGVHIVQRYFLRADSTAGSSEPNAALALACAASRYTEDAVNAQVKLEAAGSATTAIPLTGLDGQGQIVMNRVDFFHIMLGVADGTFDAPTNLRYMSVKDYMALSGAKPRIRSVQLGLVVRGTDSVSRQSGQISNTPTFTVLDQGVTLKTPSASTSSARYLRQSVMQTVALRNGLGEAAP